MPVSRGFDPWNTVSNICEAFAEELRADGYDAAAPDIGATVEV